MIDRSPKRKPVCLSACLFFLCVSLSVCLSVCQSFRLPAGRVSVSPAGERACVRGVGWARAGLRGFRVRVCIFAQKEAARRRGDPRPPRFRSGRIHPPDRPSEESVDGSDPASARRGAAGRGGCARCGAEMGGRGLGGWGRERRGGAPAGSQRGRGARRRRAPQSPPIPGNSWSAARPQRPGAMAVAGGASEVVADTDEFGVAVVVRLRPLSDAERRRAAKEAAMHAATHADSPSALVPLPKLRVVGNTLAYSGDAAAAPSSPPPAGSSPVKLPTGPWEYDAVYRPDASTAEVYLDWPASIARSVAEGCNGCVLVYGPEGAGKSHTMRGTASDPGVALRAARDVFTAAAAQAAQRESVVRAAFFQVHGEELADLLDARNEALVMRAEATSGAVV